MNSASSEERAILVRLLAAIDDPDVAAGLSASDPRVVTVARHHRLSPLLSLACKATLPAGLANIFRRDRLITAARILLLTRIAEECVGALAAAGVPTIVLKGIEYEMHLYGGRGVRATGDVDLLIPDAHRRSAFEILDRLGFEPRAAAPGFADADYHEVAWTRGGLEVDLHMGLAPTKRCPIDYERVWNDRIPFRIGAVDSAALCRPHATVFHALHMAIDHFDVPAIYLIDLIRLVRTDDELDAAVSVAATWRCERPLRTALALASELLPEWKKRHVVPVPARATRVVARFGGTDRLARSEQLIRKVQHFDSTLDALKYLLVQSRRNVREQVEKQLRGRSARDRLGLGPRP